MAGTQFWAQAYVHGLLVKPETKPERASKAAVGEPAPVKDGKAGEKI